MRIVTHGAVTRPGDVAENLRRRALVLALDPTCDPRASAAALAQRARGRPAVLREPLSRIVRRLGDRPGRVGERVADLLRAAAQVAGSDATSEGDSHEVERPSAAAVHGGQ